MANKDEKDEKSQAKEPEATEAARKRAEEKDVDLKEVEGSGKDGTIIAPDVEAAAEEAEKAEEEKPSYVYVSLADSVLDSNTESIRLSSSHGDRTFDKRQQEFLVEYEEYEELSKLKNSDGKQYVKKGGEL